MDKQTLKIRNKKGQYEKGVAPGRPKGSRNKSSIIKDELLDLFKEKKVKGRIGMLLDSKNPNHLKWFVDGIIRILPKEIELDSNMPFNLIVSGDIKPDPKHNQNDNGKNDSQKKE